MLVRTWNRAHVRPSGPFLRNLNSPLFVGLRRWWTPTASGWTQDYGLDMATNGQQGAPTLVGLPVGGVGAYCTGGSGIFIPDPNRSVAASSFTFRLVFTPISWPGAFNSLLDDAGRTVSTFFDTTGAVSFAGGYWNGALPLLTAGQRWDIIYVRNNADNSNSTYVNGILAGTGATLTEFDVDFYLAYNVSSGGTSADVNYETMQIWDRALTASDVWNLYDGATWWQLYQAPTTRSYFFTAGGRRYFLIPN